MEDWIPTSMQTGKIMLTILGLAFHHLARENPAAAFTALQAGFDGIEKDRSDVSDQDISGRGLPHYGPLLAITDASGSRTEPHSVLVHHGDFYDDPTVAASYADGSRMIAVPRQEFGVLSRPSVDGHAHEFMTLPR